MANRRRKIRADLRKNRTYRTRRTDWTRQFRQHGLEDSDAPAVERISGKGDLSRRRTVMGVEAEGTENPGFRVHLEVDEAARQRGGVLCVMGLAGLGGGEGGGSAV